jgi:hypothetical protein
MPLAACRLGSRSGVPIETVQALPDKQLFPGLVKLPVFERPPFLRLGQPLFKTGYDLLLVL